MKKKDDLKSVIKDRTNKIQTSKFLPSKPEKPSIENTKNKLEDLKKPTLEKPTKEKVKSSFSKLKNSKIVKEGKEVISSIWFDAELVYRCGIKTPDGKFWGKDDKLRNLWVKYGFRLGTMEEVELYKYVEIQKEEALSGLNHNKTINPARVLLNQYSSSFLDDKKLKQLLEQEREERRAAESRLRIVEKKNKELEKKYESLLERLTKLELAYKADDKSTKISSKIENLKPKTGLPTLKKKFGKK